MLKKILTIILILTVSLFISSSVFAEESNMIDNARNTVGNVMNDAQNAVTNGADGIKNVTGNMENTMNNVTNDIKNNFENNNRNDDNHDKLIDNGIMDNGAMTGNGNGAYSAARTTATDTNPINNSYVWIVLAIAAIVIVGAIWYYAVRSTDNNHYDDK